MKKWNRRTVLLYAVSFFAARFLIGGEGAGFYQVGMALHPFVMALFGCLCLEARLPRKLSFLVLLAGVASAGVEAAGQDMLLRYGISMLLLLFVVGVAEAPRPLPLTGKNKLSLAAMAALTGIVTAAVRAGGAFFTIENAWLLAVLEGVLAAGLTIVLQKGVHFFLYPAVLGALCGLPEINGFSPVYPGVVLSVLYLGYYYGIGAGTVAGALAGMVLGIQTGEPELVGCFALFGMVSCALGELGKIPVMLTWMMLSASAGFLWNDYFISREGLLGLLSALMLFLLIPQKKEREEPQREEAVFTNMQAVTKEKLRDISMAFHKLSELMAYPAEQKTNLGGGDLNRIFNLVSEKCCAGCERRNVCMKSEFYETYQNVFQILNRAERSGRIELSEVPEGFLERCIRSEFFLTEAGRSLELARTNLIWQNRMAENRVVVAEQFAGVAGMMDEVVMELGVSTRKWSEEEERVRECATAAGVETCQIAVKKRDDGRTEIFVTARIADGGCITTRDFGTLLGQATGRAYHTSFSSKTVISGEWATLTFLEDTPFRFYSGVASCSRDGEPRSGDSHSIQELPEGEAVLLLSDGMGSGNRASQESARMVELLEQFLDAGMEGAAAMKLIQSSLFLRGGEESFTTVDLFRVDLCSGLCRYLKVGAADSFLIRGNKLERLAYSCLPAGILAPQEAEEQSLRLREGDFLVMVTDGFLDCFEEGQAEDILRSVIGGRKQNNPNELARILLDSALIHCGGRPADDITVLVTAFWENEKLASEASGW